MVTGAAQLSEIHGRLQRGDIAGASQAIEAIVAAEPQNGPAWHLKGVIHRKAAHHISAVTAFERAIGCGEKSAELFNSLALSQQALGDFAAASDSFARSVELDPSYVPAQVNAANLTADLGRVSEAEAALRQTLAANPGSSLASNALAAIMLEAGRADLAANQYRSTLARDPGSLLATIRLGTSLREAGRPQEALDHLRSAAPRFAASPEFIDALCGALIECGAISEAERTLEELSEKAPAYFKGHRALARLAIEYGTGKDPYRSYRALVARWPKERAIWQDWFALLLDHRNHEAILDAAAEARMHTGNLADIDYCEAIARGEMGDSDGAEALFARASAVLGDQSSFAVARARNALRRGEPEQALGLASTAAERNPDDQLAWAYIGTAWRVLGDEREFWLHDYAQQVEQRTIPLLTDPDELEVLRDRLRGLHRAVRHPPDQSLRGGTQTEGALFRRSDPVIRRLVASMRELAEDFSARLPQDETHPFYRRRSKSVRFTGSWSVRLTGSGFHVAHVHQAGWLSSALHVSVPQDLEEDQPGAGQLVLGSPPAELGLGLEPRRSVQPIEGALVLFPSSMWHGTVAFTGGHERLTVAFDAEPIAGT